MFNTYLSLSNNNVFPARNKRRSKHLKKYITHTRKWKKRKRNNENRDTLTQITCTCRKKAMRTYFLIKIGNNKSALHNDWVYFVIVTRILVYFLVAQLESGARPICAFLVVSLTASDIITTNFVFTVFNSYVHYLYKYFHSLYFHSNCFVL